MLLASVGFAFLLLPFSAVCYYLISNRFKTAALMLISALFLGMMEPAAAPWALLSIAADYLAVLSVWKFELKGRARRWLLEAFCLKNLVLSAIFCVFLPLLRETPAPAGFLVISANATIYLWQLLQEKIGRLDSPCVFGAYCLFFGRLPMGPIGQTERLLPLLRAPKPSLSGIGQGVARFSVGLAKRVIFAQQLILTGKALETAAQREFSVAAAWMLVLCCALIWYFILSSYSDMAMGLAKIFSLELPRTVYFPYQSRSFAEYVYRSNMALGDHIRALLSSYSAWLCDLALPILLCVWAAPTRGAFLWGGWMALLLLLERFAFSRLPKKPGVLCRIVTYLISLPAFAFLLSGSAAGGLALVRAMFGLGGFQVVSGEVLYIIFSNGPLFLLAMVSSSSVFDQADHFIAQKFPAAHSVLSSTLNIGLIILTTSFLLEFMR